MARQVASALVTFIFIISVFIQFSKSRIACMQFDNQLDAYSGNIIINNNTCCSLI